MCFINKFDFDFDFDNIIDPSHTPYFSQLVEVLHVEIGTDVFVTMLLCDAVGCM